jgi:hypothetical protein
MSPDDRYPRPWRNRVRQALAAVRLAHAPQTVRSARVALIAGDAFALRIYRHTAAALAAAREA